MICSCNLDFIIEEPLEIDFEVGEITVIDADPYDGPYTVIPNTYEQVLSTRNKTMGSDVTVTEIPYHEVSNEYGVTVTIVS